jgi:pectate lyase
LNIHTHEPVKWIAPNGDKWILSNLASQQNLFRVLDGLTTITGDPKYRKAAMEAIEYAFENLRSPNGLLYWGGHVAYDAGSDQPCGGTDHELKFHYPYYKLMWEVDPEATRLFIESFWSAHIIDWSNLAMNRHGDTRGHLREAWVHEYKGGPVFFESKGASFINTGSDLFCSAAILSSLSGEQAPLIWSKRLARRYVETRDPATGIAGYVYTRRNTSESYPFADDFKGHRVLTGTLFPKHPGIGNPAVHQFLGGQLIVSPGIVGNVFISPWVCQFLLGDMLGKNGEEFTQWALEELTAWGKIAYRREDNSFIPMLTDGTSLEGYVCKQDSGYGPKGLVCTPIPAVSMDFWAYALAYRTTEDNFMWSMTRDIARGIGLGDIGATSQDKPQLKISPDCSDSYVLLGFLELFRKTHMSAFLQMAQMVGDNILTHRFYKGLFVPSHKHTYAKFDSIESLVLLHLHGALESGRPLAPSVWPSRPFFQFPYRRKARAVDNAIIYSLAGLSKPPKSLHEVAAEGDIEAVRLMILRGSDINGREDSLLRTALHRAAMEGHKPVVELLLVNGARVNPRDSSQSTPLHYSVEKGHRETAELLIAKGADVNAKNNRDLTALWYAKENDHTEIVELLRKHGAKE